MWVIWNVENPREKYSSLRRIEDIKFPEFGKIYFGEEGRGLDPSKEDEPLPCDIAGVLAIEVDGFRIDIGEGVKSWFPKSDFIPYNP